MSQKENIWDTSHRPWPIPSLPWVMKHTWKDVLFIHYPIKLDLLRELVPKALPLDCYDGWGWIGIVPFKMKKAGLRWIPVSLQFAQINVRTYVVIENKPGLYFFSIDAASLPTVLMGRLFNLPYFLAKIEYDEQSLLFKSSRAKDSSVQFDGSFNPHKPKFFAEKGSFEEWLTGRYCFYSLNTAGVLRRCEILHRPWPLQKAEANIHVNQLLSKQSIHVDSSKAIVHYSAGVDVRVWPIVRV